MKNLYFGPILTPLGPKPSKKDFSPKKVWVNFKTLCCYNYTQNLKKKKKKTEKFSFFHLIHCKNADSSRNLKNLFWGLFWALLARQPQKIFSNNPARSLTTLDETPTLTKNKKTSTSGFRTIHRTFTLWDQ